MYVSRDFPPVEDQSARLLGIDLDLLLDAGETISGVTAALRTISGTDLLPQTHTPVAAQSSGSLVSQLVVFDDPALILVGNRYSLVFTVTTSAARVLKPWSRLQVVTGWGVTSYAGGNPPASAQSVVLQAGPLYYTLPTQQGGYAGQDLPPATQGETLAYGFDFSAALSPNETIDSAEASLVLLSGTDAAVTASPSAYHSGNAAIDGGTVTQSIVWPPGSALATNLYALNIIALTSFDQALTAWARIVVGPVG